MCMSTTERKTTKETGTTWYEKQEKKRTRSLEYPNTKIWRRKLDQKMSAVSII